MFFMPSSESQITDHNNVKNNNQKLNPDNFTKNGLYYIDMAVFSRKNLIIGKNGSGKTRFLKVLEQEKKQDKTKEQTVITLYFPEIQAFYNSDQPEQQEDAIYPYDLLLEHEDNSFYDFLKVMENDRADFLNNILSVLSMKNTRKSRDATKLLKELNALLRIFIGRIIIHRENKIYITSAVHDGSERTLPLREALSEFSPGELMLFYLSVFLILIKQKHSEGLILIIDEPELHLHPHALVEMIRNLKNSENVVELWVASHSLFLVPLFEFEEIVFMERNIVSSRDSKMYKKLYDSLVGLENDNLFEFLKSLDSWQYYQFIAECFCLPKPVDKANPGDAQFCKLLDAIKSTLGYKPVKMLDYGAGKCRIWECMQLLPSADPRKQQLSYTAYEPYTEDDLPNEIKLYKDFSDICKDQQQFHVVILMNVLHEIEVTQWEQTFQHIKSVLTDDGILIFIEVLSLTKGEQPYGNNGYLILQDEQVRLLFNDADIINLRMDPKEKSNCWVMTKAQVENVTQETIMQSISYLKQASYDALKAEYRERIESAHKTDGQQKEMSVRQYAFLSQQYINASFAQEMLKGNVL